MIPANIFIEINPEDVPPGPSGKSAYQTWLDNGHTGTEVDFLEWLRNGQSCGGAAIKHSSVPGVISTDQISYAASGLSCTVSVVSGQKILIDVRGVVSRTPDGIVHFTIRRNGVDLHSSPQTGLSVIRADNADAARTLSFIHQDTATVTGNVTYELFWKCHNQANAYLGKRSVDSAWIIPTTMTVTVHD